MQTDENRFIVLLEKHLANKALPEEVLQLLQMIKSGLYDKLLKQRIDHSLSDEPAKEDLSVEAAHHLLYKILSSEEKTDRLIPIASPFIRYRLGLSVAAAFLLLIVTGWLLWPSGPKSQVAKTATQRASAPPDTGNAKFIRLPDGSSVLLHGGSRLIVGQAFNTKTREVTLSGEGYFDIHSDDTRPFIVHAKAVNTTVLGTAFNVRAWPGQPEVTVTVTRGKVKVSDTSRVYGIIGSNEQIVVNSHTNGFTNQLVNAESIIAWKKDYLVLDDIGLAEAARLIGNKYHVNIVLENDRMKSCRISATFLAHESMEQVLDVVCAVVEGNYTVQPNDQVLINGKGCN